MSQELWEIVQRGELEEAELQLALQCAPLIAGLKVSNLLNIRKDLFSRMKEIVKDSHLSWFLLLENEEKVTVLLYHRRSLETYLAQGKVREQLRKAGYRSLTLRDILSGFRERYRRYMHSQCGDDRYTKDREEFPHEMGLLLGYPVEDVEGFVKNKGNNFLCTGYWKVYENQDRKQKLFERFEHAKENLIWLLSYGMSMGDIIDICCKRGQQVAHMND
ncbi:MAG: DUF3793 family protein [Lachnospiraceae bacterium]|nr:DUF3793 family protein [Lachnospiraceae bacterium]